MRAAGRLILFAAALSLLVSGSASAATSFQARGSSSQVYATGLPAGAAVTLLNSADAVVATRNANSLGGIVFRDVAPGPGYRVRVASLNETSDPVTVMSNDPTPPSTDIYDQSIPQDGYGYMTTRDGIKLAYSVHPPADAANALGQELPEEVVEQLTGFSAPFPTLIEYSGYGYARPEGPQSGIAAVANLMGFTVVDVNMRGTGCSGGAFDFFDHLQNLDGYDVIETVARQPWVKGNQVGMLGISYGGISQLFTAQTQPPSLAAIAPLSVIDQVVTTLYPGGILNNGFAFDWARERDQNAQAATAPGRGQGWAWDRIQGGDTTCAENQVLHPEANNLEATIRDNPTYKPEVVDHLSPITFVDKIEVPTFMACQWTDEQTGGHCPTLASRLTGTDTKRITFTNGTHVDSLSPEVLNQMYDFLHLYVAEQPPALFAPLFQAAAPAIYQAVFGISGPEGSPPAMPPPADPVQLIPEYGLAKAAFEADPDVRILFDNGAGSADNPGWPYPSFEESFESWPPPAAAAREWFVGPGGSLSEQPPAAGAADRFTWDADARPKNDFSGSTGGGTNGLWTDTPNYQWSQDPPGTAVAYATDPFAEDTTVLGSGRIDLWVRAREPRVDLQATVSEVRPDGVETFVQGGWLRGDARALDPAKSTLLEPVLGLRESDLEPMPIGEFEPVTIPLYYEGHAYRQGSRLRIRISAPNGDQPIWSFAETLPEGQTEVDIGYGPAMRSRVLLPVVPGIDAPEALPPCPFGLRGEPCRDYQPFVNRAASLLPDVRTKCSVRRTGTPGRDVFRPTRDADLFLGLGGDDRLKGGAADDCLFGGTGDDKVWGGAADDRIYGGNGIDRVGGGSGDDTVAGGRGRDRLWGGPGDDLILAADHWRDVIRCGPGFDRVRASRNDTVARNCERVKRVGRRR